LDSENLKVKTGRFSMIGVLTGLENATPLSNFVFLDWQVQGIEITQLLPKENKKRKKKHKEEAKPLSDGNAEEAQANNDKQDTETAAEVEETEESVSVKVIRCSSVKPTDIAAKLRGLF
jgi:hypothetical protein